jgi:positive regulator of sigma E activity
MVGSLVGLAIASGSQKNTQGEVIVIRGAVVGAVLGFNLTRRYDAGTAAAVGALVQVRPGHVSVGVPVVTRARGADAMITSVPVIAGSF